MDIVWTKTLSLLDGDEHKGGQLFAALVKVVDLSKVASDMHDRITDTSWIKKMDVANQIAFNATSKRTIDKLVECIANRTSNNLSEDFGEYLISDAALEVMNSKFNHIKIPLAELIKEKISGNPGFDFHSEAPEKIIAYGEAKYSGIISRYADALKQITSFIELKKDDAELHLLRSFVSEQAVANYASGKKSYVAAFSITAADPEKVMANAIKSDHINSLANYDGLYLIGVFIDVK